MEALSEIKSKIENRFKTRDYNDLEISLEKNDKNIDLKIKQMYEHISLNFEDMLFLSDLFKTTDISSSNYSHDGCETCDYGSEYGTEFTIKNIGIELE